MRPISVKHWALVKRCWSLVPQRPPAEDAVSSLQQLPGACPFASSSASQHHPPAYRIILANDNLHPPPFEGARGRAEELFNGVIGSNFEQTDEWVTLCLVQMCLVLMLDCVSSAEQSLQDLNRVQWVAFQSGVLPASLHIVGGLIA